MLVFPYCLSPTQDPIIPPEAGKNSLRARMVQLVVIILDEQLCDVVFWIHDNWVDIVVIQILTFPKPTTHSDQVSGMIELRGQTV